MPKIIDRRAALGLMVGAPALAVLPIAAKAARTPISPEDRLALDLWERRYALRQPFMEAYRARNEAEARMPWWAINGYSFLESDGSVSGPFVGWPAIQGVKPSERSRASKLIRPGPSDLRQAFVHAQNLWGGNSGLKEYQDDLLALEERLKAQGDEERRSGLTEADLTLEDLHEQHGAICDQINELPITAPNVAAAKLILELIAQSKVSEAASASSEVCIAMIALRHLRPALVGIIADHVDELLSDGDRRLASYQCFEGDPDHGRIPLQEYPGKAQAAVA